MSEPTQRVDFFRPPQRPNGGTVYVRPADSGNPYAHVDEPLFLVPVVDVQLPPFEDDTAGPPLSAA